MSDIYRSKKGIGVSESIKRILNKEYSINIEWFETGNGEMFNLGEPILKQPSMYYGGEDFEMPTYVPLLPISAQGGSLNDFVVSVKDSDCEKIISPIKGADFAITVSGDSMSLNIRVVQKY